MKMKVRAALLWLLAMSVILVFVYNQSGLSILSRLVSPTRRNASEQYVVYVCDGSFPCGGWADRQKGIVSAYVMAKLMGRRFRVKMTKPCDLKTYMDQNSEPWELSPDEVLEMSVQYIKKIDKQADELRKKMSSMNLTTEYQNDVIYFTSNMEYVEYLLQNSKYTNETEWMRKMKVADLYVDVLNRLFKINTSLKEKFGNFSLSIPRNKGVKLACAQIRLGKNPTLPKDSEEFNSKESVNVVWDFLKQYNDTTKYRIFVTSDSEDVRKDAAATFPTSSVDTKGDIVHIERSVGSNVCDGFGKVILDQLVLSTCDVLVISRSGLARIAAWYRGKADDLYCFSKSRVDPCDPYNLTSLIPEW